MRLIFVHNVVNVASGVDPLIRKLWVTLETPTRCSVSHQTFRPFHRPFLTFTEVRRRGNHGFVVYVDVGLHNKKEHCSFTVSFDFVVQRHFQAD